jgi:hypothetical protein
MGRETQVLFTGRVVNEIPRKLAQSQESSTKVAPLLQRRLKLAQERFAARIQAATKFDATSGVPATPWGAWQGAAQYAVDLTQRSILFCETLRQRGNNFLEHELAGKPFLLHFDQETVLDARSFDRPVNYALLRIVPQLIAVAHFTPRSLR